MNIRFDGKEIRRRQGNRFEYLGGTVTRDGKSKAEVRRRVEGVMADRKISRKLKGNILMSCVMPAYLYGLEMVALTERHQQRLHVCKNWVRRIAGVQSADKRMMDGLREEIGMQMRLTGRLVKCRLIWAGHLV